MFVVKQESAMLASGIVKTPGAQAEEGTLLTRVGGEECEEKVGQIEGSWGGTEQEMYPYWKSVGEYGCENFPRPVLLYPLWGMAEEGQEGKGGKRWFI